MDGYSEKHWDQVLKLVKQTACAAGFEPAMVSDNDHVDIIQKNIVQNIYHDEIVVCDVSGKNPNVMFELGLRLAFDRPTVIIKDNITKYSFDTSIIEHIIYPQDLNHFDILEFNKTLKDKIKATHKIAQDDPKYSPFLKSFVELKAAKIETKEVEINQDVIDMFLTLRSDIKASQRQLVNISSEACDAYVSKEFGEEILNSVVNYITDNNIASLVALQSNKKDIINYVFDKMTLTKVQKHFNTYDEYVEFINNIISSGPDIMKIRHVIRKQRRHG